MNALAVSTIPKKSVTILLCNYNHGRYLRQSLGAICEQTRPADVIQIVDDGSTDNSREIIAEFQEKYPSIRVLFNETNQGLMASVWKVLPHIDTEYMVWAAADDLLLPNFLEKSMAAVEAHPEAGLVFSELTVMFGDTGVIDAFARNPTVAHTFNLDDLPPFMTPQELIVRMQRAYLPITGNSVVVRHDALMHMGGFNPALEWHTDLLAFYIIALRFGACVISETLAYIRSDPGSYSGAGMRNPERQMKVVQALLDYLSEPHLADVRKIFKLTPCFFSVWGVMVLELMLRKPRDWDLAWPYFLWKAREYKRGHGLTWGKVISNFVARGLTNLKVSLPSPAKKAKALNKLGLATAEKNQLQQEVALLKSQLGDLEAQRDGAANELVRVRGELAGANAERGELIQYVAKLKKGWELAALGLGQAQAQVDQFQKLVDHAGGLATQICELAEWFKIRPDLVTAIRDVNSQDHPDPQQLHLSVSRLLDLLSAIAVEIHDLRTTKGKIESNLSDHAKWLNDMSSERARLLALVDQMSKELGEATEERDGYKNAWPELQSEKTRLATLVGDLSAERDGAVNGRLALEQELAGLRVSLGDLSAERDGAVNGRLALERELAGLRASLGDLSAERDGLLGSVESLKKELNHNFDIVNQLSKVTKDDEFFEEFLNSKADLIDRTREEFGGRLPSILLTTMPKSGTYYLGEYFSKGAAYRKLVVGHQYFPHDMVQFSNLEKFANGEYVSLDHFDASALNVHFIANLIGKIVVHVRDPRQAMLSYIRYLERTRFVADKGMSRAFIYPALPEDYFDQDLANRLDWGINFWLPELVKWVAGWQEAATRPDLKVKFCKFEDMRHDPEAYASDVCEFFGIPATRWSQPNVKPEDGIHFRKGDVAEWRQVLTPEQQNRASAMIPVDMAKQFGWSLGATEPIDNQRPLAKKRSKH